MVNRVAFAMVTATTSMLVLFPSAASIAGQTSRGERPRQTLTAPASSAERSALIQALADKWSSHVQSAFGVDAEMWRERLRVQLGAVDETNLRDAVARDTYEGAMATLVGRGERVADAGRVSGAAATSELSDSLLGALTSDLVYTPIQPCRIVDTRFMAAGAIPQNGSRSFIAMNVTDFIPQGGSVTDCGTLGLSATAIAMHLTAVFPLGGGHATVFPFGTTQPLAASVNYASGAVQNNTVISKIPNPVSTFDFTIFSSRLAHYVVDIVGYFAPNVATPLQCVDTAPASITVAGDGTGEVTAPACPAGYTQTATNCNSTSWDMQIVESWGGACAATNYGASAATLQAARTCCRVPGR